MVKLRDFWFVKFHTHTFGANNTFYQGKACDLFLSPYCCIIDVFNREYTCEVGWALVLFSIQFTFLLKNHEMVIVNARFLTQHITGVQRFAIEISKELKRRYNGEIEFVTHPGIIHKELYDLLGAKTIGYSKSHIWEQVDLYLYLLKKSNPLLVSFGYTGPLFYKRQIVTIHDMAFKFYRNTFSKSFGLIYNFLVPRLALKALHIFTVSESAKNELVEQLNVERKKITVIYNGITDVFKIKGPKNKDFKIKGKYILTVSSHHPRKNYKRLIQAFGEIEDTSIKLFVIGNKVSNFADDLREDKGTINNRVVFLKNITDIELASYYMNADLFVFPSLYEGFGIPVIEAMIFGKTCVLSDIPVFREIGNKDVIYVDPHSTDSIKNGIEKGLKMDKSPKEYSKLENFSWSKSAETVYKVINDFKD